jgi:hypothetical protein
VIAWFHTRSLDIITRTTRTYGSLRIDRIRAAKRRDASRSRADNGTFGAERRAAEIEA